MMQQHRDLVRKTTVKVLLSEDELRDGVKRMADEINAQLENKTLTVIAEMTGSMELVADLMANRNCLLCSFKVTSGDYG